MKRIIHLPFTFFMVLILLTALVRSVDAAPGFARQTGLSCSACHNVFPQLNSFGRMFKMNGYTLVTVKTIEEKSDNGKEKLKIMSIAPLAVMVQSSYSALNRKIPGTQNSNFEFPQQLSTFFSGIIAPKIGAFIQFTYEQQTGSLGIDNIDIRYANQTTLGSKDLSYGFTLNNNPSVQDVWNTLPAWSFPFASSPVAPTPSASAILEGGLSQQVAGLGAYALFNNHIYGELSLYRSAQQGAADPPGAGSSMIIRGAAPYWRLAYQFQWQTSYLEIGTFGLYSNIYPVGVSGLTDKYTDIGFDLQYEHSLPKADLIVHSRWIHEFRKLEASLLAGNARNSSNNLNSFRLDGDLWFRKGYGFTVAYFITGGSSDDILYSPGEISGSRTGNPGSNGFILQAGCIPWLNTQFTVQYVFNTMFNGASSNYDDHGRNAMENNALYLLAWINF